MKNPLGVSPSKGYQGTTRGKEKILMTSVGIEPTTSGLDLPLLCLYTDITEGVRVGDTFLMLPTKFSHNVIFMVPNGSAIMACWSCRFLEPTVFEGYKWQLL